MSKPAAGMFFETDFSKFMDMSKMMSEFKLPLFNFEAMMSAHRRNIEAYTAVNQAAMEGWQALLRRQSDIMRQSLEDCSSLVSAVMASPTPHEKMIKQAEASKVMVDKAIANTRDLADTMTKANQRAMDTVSTRLSESIEELRGMMKTSAQQVAKVA